MLQADTPVQVCEYMIVHAKLEKNDDHLLSSLGRLEGLAL